VSCENCCNCEGREDCGCCEKETRLRNALKLAIDELTKVHRYFRAVDKKNAVSLDGAEISARGAVRDSIFERLEEALKNE
jgi:hypothetical protein